MMPELTTAGEQKGGAEKLGAGALRQAGLHGCRALHPADLVQFVLERQPMERRDRQSGEHRRALVEHAVSVLERDLPMRGHRLSRPERAGFAGGVVANREYEIERRHVRRGKFASFNFAGALRPRRKQRKHWYQKHVLDS
jgi:hypothetical protein